MNIIIFDGVCNLCNGFVQHIIKNDKKAIFKFATLQSVIAQELLKNNQDFTQIDTVILIRNNVVFIKSKAVFEIAKLLKGYYLLLIPFSILPTFITDFCYDLVAKYRYKLFGKKATCMLPSQAIKNRFL